MYFKDFDFSDFWDNNEYSIKNYIGETPTDRDISNVEKDLGYKLPESYIWLMKRHNGGMTFKDSYLMNEPTSWSRDHIAISGIYGVDCKKDYSICGDMGSKFWIEEWEYPDIGIAICDCPSAGHDMIFLDYRECGKNGEPQVVHIDQEYDYKITFVAKDFETFIRELINYEE